MQQSETYNQYLIYYLPDFKDDYIMQVNYNFVFEQPKIAFYNCAEHELTFMGGDCAVCVWRIKKRKAKPVISLPPFSSFNYILSSLN